MRLSLFLIIWRRIFWLGGTGLAASFDTKNIVLNYTVWKLATLRTVPTSVCDVYFFNIVSAQPSTTISWVADKKLMTKTTIVSILRFGVPTSGNHSSILFARYSNNNPILRTIIILKKNNSSVQKIIRNVWPFSAKIVPFLFPPILFSAEIKKRRFPFRSKPCLSLFHRFAFWPFFKFLIIYHMAYSIHRIIESHHFCAKY